jgi:hypothetical protein
MARNAEEREETHKRENMQTTNTDAMHAEARSQEASSKLFFTTCPLTRDSPDPQR